MGRNVSVSVRKDEARDRPVRRRRRTIPSHAFACNYSTVLVARPSNTSHYAPFHIDEPRAKRSFVSLAPSRAERVAVRAS